AWKDAGLPATRIFAYDETDQNVEITNPASHTVALDNPPLSVPVITTTSPLPSATAGTIYRDTLRSQGGSLPVTWSLNAGALPTGITLSAAGIVSGTATVAGVYNFTARATDNAGEFDN